MFARFAALVCAAALSSFASALAQEGPNLKPDASVVRTYEDLGMHVEVSDTCVVSAQRPFSIDALESAGNLQPFAQWACNRNAPVQVTISEEPFTGGTDSSAFESNFSNEIRTSIEGVLIKRHARVALSNGYPAIFDEITAGEGFNVTKMYVWVWADGLRGVAVQVIGPVGSIDEARAKALMKKISAVVFPTYRLERRPPR